MTRIQPMAKKTSKNKEVKFTQPKGGKKRKDDERSLQARCWKDFQAAQAARKKYDWEWVTRDLFVRGYQFARYNPNSQTFVMAGRTKVRIPINLTYAQMRSVKNQVTNFQPKWEVLPRNIDDKSQWNAHCSGRLLDYLYEELKLRRKVKEAVIHGLKFSVGIWQVGWDEKADDGGQVRVDVIDPFDLFIDPNATSLDDATFVIKAVRKPIAEIKANKHYENTEKLGKSKELAASEYKAFLMQAVRNWEQSPTEESEYTILYEMWRKEWDDEGNQKMRVVTFVKDNDRLLRDETFDRTDYPFYIYQADINPLEIYGEGWARHVIALNRVINALEGGVFEYNHIFGKGRFVIDRNSGVRMISNQHGQIIEKNRGADVNSLNLAPLPNAPFAQLGNFQSYLQDIGGAHDISLGRAPTGIKSGVGIAQLRQNDAMNQADLVDNLEDFLVSVGQGILKEVAEHYQATRVIEITGKGGELEYFLALGENSKQPKKDKLKKGGSDLPVAMIGKSNRVRVTIGSWLNQTLGAKQERLEALYTAGAVDQQTLLEHLEFGDVDGIIQRTREEKTSGVGPITPGVTGKGQGEAGEAPPAGGMPPAGPMGGMPQAGGMPPMGQPPMGGGQPPTDQGMLAEAENQAMLQGKFDVVVVDPGDDHQLHIQIHQQIVTQVPEAQRHIDEHQQMMGSI